MRNAAFTAVSVVLLLATALPLVAEWDPNKKCLGSKDGPPLRHVAFSGDGKDVWHELIATPFSTVDDSPKNRPTLDSYARQSIGPWAIDDNHRKGGAFAQIAFAYVDYYFRQLQSASTRGTGIFPGAQCVDLSGATITVVVNRANLDFGDKIDAKGAELRFWFQTSTEDITRNSAPAPASPTSVSPPYYGGPKLNYTYIKNGIKLPKPGSGPVTTTLRLSSELSAWKCMGYNENQPLYDPETKGKKYRTNKGGYICLGDQDQEDFAKWLSTVYLDFGFLLFLPNAYGTSDASFDKWEDRRIHDRWPHGRIEFGSISLTKQ
jgi:hypothetical protein